MSSTRWMLGTLVVVLVIAVAAVVVSTGRGPVELPDDEPAGVVQRYLQAVADDEATAAVATFSTELQERCDPAFDPGRHQDDLSFRAELVDTEHVGDEAHVTVEITEFHGDPPFGSDAWDHTERFVLRREDGAWRIVEPPWPYPPCRAPA